MSRLRELLRVFDRQAAEKQAEKLRTLAALNRTLRQEIKDLREASSRLTELTHALQVRTEQLATLRRADAEAGAHLARLSPLFDVERVAAHVRSAVSRAEVIGEPVRHLAIRGLLPPDAYAAVVEAIPPRVVFEDRQPDRPEIGVPPRLAPVASIVAWEFAASAIVRAVLAPAIAVRFEREGTLRVLAERLVLYTAGQAVRPVTAASGRIRVFISLAGADTAAAPGVRLARTDAVDAAIASAPASLIPLPPNVLVAVLEDFGGCGTVVPPDARAGGEHCVWEFDIGVE